ncbi:hypothetical protein niasHT_011627 [Heterodera trifolii]|uniref:Innexin n=1 Tax=Heterodera trifolii TaxID=157864 RepID=A0ABD2LGZ6_9BILA
MPPLFRSVPNPFLPESNLDSAIFPRISLCDIQIRRLGDTPRYTLQCHLRINTYNEKIYLFIWWGFGLVAILTTINFVYYLFVLLLFPWTQERSVRHLLKQDKYREIVYSNNRRECRLIRRFAEHALRKDGILLFWFIEGHAGPIVARELMGELFEIYKTDMHEEDDEQPSEVSVVNEKVKGSFLAQNTGSLGDDTYGGIAQRFGNAGISSSSPSKFLPEATSFFSSQERELLNTDGNSTEQTGLYSSKLKQKLLPNDNNNDIKPYHYHQQHNQNIGGRNNGRYPAHADRPGEKTTGDSRRRNAADIGTGGGSGGGSGGFLSSVFRRLGNAVLGHPSSSPSHRSHPYASASFYGRSPIKQQKFPLGMAHHHPLMPTPPVSCPSSQLHQQNVCHVDIVEQHQQHNANGSTLLCPQSLPGKNNGNKMASPNANFGEEELARQVSERKMSAEREAQRAFEEERMREREEPERVTREEAEREAEERRRMDRIETRDQTERSTLACLQRAQREAELLRRAKLFRHILLYGDGQADMKTAREVLKCESEEEAVMNVLVFQSARIRPAEAFSQRKLRQLKSVDGKSDAKIDKRRGKGGGQSDASGGVQQGEQLECEAFAYNADRFLSAICCATVENAIAGCHNFIVDGKPSAKKCSTTVKKTPKTTDNERQNAIITAATASVSSPSQFHPHNYGSATVISPNIASSAGGAPYGSSESEKSTPDKKSFRQKVQNAVRNGAAAMLRRRESTGKTPTTPPNGGVTPKVLRTVGLVSDRQTAQQKSDHGKGGGPSQG